MKSRAFLAAEEAGAAGPLHHVERGGEQATDMRWLSLPKLQAVDSHGKAQALPRGAAPPLRTCNIIDLTSQCRP